MGKVESIGSPLGALGAPTPISKSHNLARFTCGKEPLDDFLRLRAMKSEGKNARTYVVCQGDVVIGFYSIAMGAVQRMQAPGKLRRNAPDSIPVAILARMAVDARFRGHGIGAGMLKDALRRMVQAATIIGARAVLVHAIDDEARPFYLKYGFIEYPAESRTLYMPIETLVDGL
jgi:GNAT superfamily N-acetyltransferase